MSKQDEFDFYNDTYSDLPDGAYLAAMEEAGITVEDMEALADEEGKVMTTEQRKRREKKDD